MKHDFSRPGLYYLLRTQDVMQGISDAGVAERASFLKGDSAKIAKLVASCFAAKVETYVQARIDDEGESEHDADWIARILADFPTSKELERIAREVLPSDDQVLSEIKQTSTAHNSLRPSTELIESDLIVPDGRSPQLGNEIRLELGSSDHVDWLVSFIKVKAIKSLESQLKAFCMQPNPDGSPRLRIATTTYIGATDYEALRVLFSLPNTEVRICFDSSKTRLHAKAYIFKRNSGFGSAYIGSANLSVPALSSGLEWTVKVSQFEMPRLWERANLAFETCWNDASFEKCTELDEERIRSALRSGKIVQHKKNDSTLSSSHSHLFIPRPLHFQETMLESLLAERKSGRSRHLVVSATGTGKTYVAAFDFAQMTKEKGGWPTLLFVVHRTDILRQALEKYRDVLGSDSFGCIAREGGSGKSARQCFCTVQSWRNHVKNVYPKNFFDLIVLDECHHAEAASYQELLEFYKTEIDQGQTDLLGLTATPFRTDAKSLRPDFGGSFTHELSLAESIENGFITPFTYFGIDDSTDFSDIDWTHELTAKTQIENRLRSNGWNCQHVYQTICEYVAEPENMRAIAFCAGLDHAQNVCKFMQTKGLKAVVLSGQSSSEERMKAIRGMEQIPPEINLILTADLFNEGVDIPCVDTVLMLRPTSSALIFVQQLGRGLRHAPLQYDKSDLLVLDFVGNYNEKYQGFSRFQAMSTRPDVPIKDQIVKGMPFVPAGCSVHLTKQCQEKVLKNLEAHLRSLQGRTLRSHIVHLIQDAKRHLSLEELMGNLDCTAPTPIFTVGTPSSLEAEALHGSLADNHIGKKFISLSWNDSPEMLKEWLRILQNPIEFLDDAQTQLVRFLLLSHFDASATLEKTEAVWKKLQGEPGLIVDLREFLSWRLSSIKPLPHVSFPGLTRFLELHRTYTIRQLSALLGSTGSPIQSGVYYNSERNMDAFFITRNKSEKDYSPTTLYNDFAKSSSIFRWESPSRTAIASPAGQRYITNQSTKMLFLRRAKTKRTDFSRQYSIPQQTEAYVFLGPAKTVLAHEDEMPIKIDYELVYPLPAEVSDFARGA